MESQPSSPPTPEAARERLRAARRAHDASVRRAMAPAWAILALSVFAGAQTLAPDHRGPGDVVSVIAIIVLLTALLTLCARNRWRPLRLMPKPRWNAGESALIALAVLVGGLVCPHLLAGLRTTAAGSWALAAAVAATVAVCMFAAYASARRRSDRAWPR